MAGVDLLNAPVIFHSPLEPQASPMLCGSWKLSPVELLAQSGAVGGFGNDVYQVCGLFIQWCLARQPEAAAHLFVRNLPGIPWEDDWDVRAWYEQLISTARTWESQPVLADVDHYEITQGGVVLWRNELSRSTVEAREALATRVEVNEDTLSVELADGRTIAAPLAWYPRLAHAMAEERDSWRLIGGGRGIHWPAIDEDISVANLLAGQPSAESQSSFKRWLTRRAKPSRRRKRPGAESDPAGDRPRE